MARKKQTYKPRPIKEDRILAGFNGQEINFDDDLALEAEPVDTMAAELPKRKRDPRDEGEAVDQTEGTPKVKRPRHNTMHAASELEPEAQRSEGNGKLSTTKVGGKSSVVEKTKSKDSYDSLFDDSSNAPAESQPGGKEGSTKSRSSARLREKQVAQDALKAKSVSTEAAEIITITFYWPGLERGEGLEETEWLENKWPKVFTPRADPDHTESRAGQEDVMKRHTRWIQNKLVAYNTAGIRQSANGYYDNTNIAFRAELAASMKLFWGGGTPTEAMMAYLTYRRDEIVRRIYEIENRNPKKPRKVEQISLGAKETLRLRKAQKKAAEAAAEEAAALEERARYRADFKGAQERKDRAAQALKEHKQMRKDHAKNMKETKTTTARKQAQKFFKEDMDEFMAGTQSFTDELQELFDKDAQVRQNDRERAAAARAREEEEDDIVFQRQRNQAAIKAERALAAKAAQELKDRKAAAERGEAIVDLDSVEEVEGPPQPAPRIVQYRRIEGRVKPDVVQGPNETDEEFRKRDKRAAKAFTELEKEDKYHLWQRNVVKQSATKTKEATELKCQERMEALLKKHAEEEKKAARADRKATRQAERKAGEDSIKTSVTRSQKSLRPSEEARRLSREAAIARGKADREEKAAKAQTAFERTNARDEAKKQRQIVYAEKAEALRLERLELGLGPYERALDPDGDEKNELGVKLEDADMPQGYTRNSEKRKAIKIAHRQERWLVMAQRAQRKRQDHSLTKSERFAARNRTLEHHERTDTYQTPEDLQQEQDEIEAAAEQQKQREASAERKKYDKIIADDAAEKAERKAKRDARRERKRKEKQAEKDAKKNLA